MQIPLSQLKSMKIDAVEFEAAVQAHIADLHAFAKTIGKPRPTPKFPIIEHCLKRTQRNGLPDIYTPDYQIVDDTPELIPPTLGEKKQMCTDKVLAAEHAALERIVPTRKRRLWQVQNAAVQQQLHSVQVKDKVSHTSEDKETIAHCTAALDAVKQVEDRFKAINTRTAYALAAIEDLTEDNIDMWQCPPLE